MRIIHIEQRSQEWFQYKAGKISGTRRGQLVSNRKNKLLYELVNEVLDGTIIPNDFVSDDMQRGIDLEPYAIAEYEKITGNKVDVVGIIQNDKYPISMHSPDGCVGDNIVIEVKCPAPVGHLQSYKEGHSYMDQIINAFVVEDKITEVHYFSFCPDRPELPYFLLKYYRKDFEKEILATNTKLEEMQTKVNELVNELRF